MDTQCLGTKWMVGNRKATIMTDICLFSSLISAACWVNARVQLDISKLDISTVR